MVCRDSKETIITNSGKKIGNGPMLVVEAIVIRETSRMTRDHNMNNIVIESNS